MIDPLHERAAREIATEAEGTDERWQLYLPTGPVAWRRFNLATSALWSATGIPQQLSRLLDTIARLFK